MTAVLKYDAACRALAEAKSFDEVKSWEDKAAAVKEYARRARNRGLELDALEIRERARRRRGELLLELKAEGRLAKGPRREPLPDGGAVPLTLDELDTSANESARDQKLAQMDGDSFERLVARCRSYMQDNPEKHSFESIPVDGAIKGARSVMASRAEPDDSLDFFPTPPFATRALIEHVFGALPECAMDSVWEPACGEGHMAEVLREYCQRVIVSDVFDYGFGGTLDFLSDDAAGYECDWIITNPPFSEGRTDRTLEFTLKALDLASVGVAMLVRSQWAVEGIGRYDRLFRRQPPTLISFFTERVPIWKGQWNPDGGTATAYCWLTWVKDAYPRAPFWIPPGCRKLLERPGDRERFTAHPVIRKEIEPAKVIEKPVAKPPLRDVEIPEMLRGVGT